MTEQVWAGECLVPGVARGEVLASDTAISLLLGVDVATGEVIDAHHPLRGTSLAGKIVVVPSGRGSCSASGGLLEMILAGVAPAALVFCHPETILTLGSIIAEEFFGQGIPVIRLPEAQHRALRSARTALVVDGVVVADPPGDLTVDALRGSIDAPPERTRVFLSPEDERMLRGDHGEAARRAMRVVLRAAASEGVTELVDVTQVHIDGNFYQGRGSLELPEQLVAMGAAVRVPTTCNSLTVDRERWQAVGVDAAQGAPAERVADAYVAMGVTPSYTCAPYLLDSRPAFGEQIAWAESNAVVYANSVIGARTLKYPDYLDILVALTGRAPAASTHLPLARRATTRIDVVAPAQIDDSFMPVLGHIVGELAVNEIPVVCGLEALTLSRDDLRAFGAAFATTSAAPMFHIVGHTPEALTLEAAIREPVPGELDTAAATLGLRVCEVGPRELARAYAELNTTSRTDVSLVALGNPHFSLDEFRRLAERCSEGRVADGVECIVTCGRAIRDRAAAEGLVEPIERAGVQLFTDTCWCFIEAPIVPRADGVVMTNSAKYAHYGPGTVGAGMRFGSFDACVDAAFSGIAPLHTGR